MSNASGPTGDQHGSRALTDAPAAELERHLEAGERLEHWAQGYIPAPPMRVFFAVATLLGFMALIGWLSVFTTVTRSTEASWGIAALFLVLVGALSFMTQKPFTMAMTDRRILVTRKRGRKSSHTAICAQFAIDDKPSIELDRQAKVWVVTIVGGGNSFSGDVHLDASLSAIEAMIGDLAPRQSARRGGDTP